MATFEMRVRTARGYKSMRLHALDEDTAKRLGAKHGSVQRIQKVFSWDFLPGMTDGERSLWLYRMSKMLLHRVPLTTALRIMGDNFGGEIRKASRRMLLQIEQGNTIVEAIEQDPRNFPKTTAALVKAGMLSGNSGLALQGVAEYEKRINMIRRNSAAQIHQAIAVFFLAFAITYYSTEILAPQVLDNVLFKRPGVDTFDWTRTLGVWTMAVMAVVIVQLTALLGLSTIGRRLAPERADKIVLKIPFYKDLVLARQNQLALFRLGLLIKQDVSVTEALTISEEDTPAGALKTDFRKALTSMRKGQPWPREMTNLHPTDKAALATSSDKNDVAETLISLSEQYGDLYMLRLNTIGPLLKTAAATFLVASGGLAFMQVMLPVMALMNSIQR